MNSVSAELLAGWVCTQCGDLSGALVLVPVRMAPMGWTEPNWGYIPYNGMNVGAQEVQQQNVQLCVHSPSRQYNWCVHSWCKHPSERPSGRVPADHLTLCHVSCTAWT